MLPPPSPSSSLESELHLPLELLDELVRLCGWRAWGTVWSKVCKRYRSVEQLMDCRRSGTSLDVVVIVPDDAHGVNAGIALAAERSHSSNMKGKRPAVLVRPGHYREAVRVTADVALCALGKRGSAAIYAPGWEPALAWGGFKVGATSASGTNGSSEFRLQASSAGAASEVCGFALVQRNQAQ